MKISIPITEGVAELPVEMANGSQRNYRFKVPPVIGTHSEVFQALRKQAGSREIERIPQGIDIVAYAMGCLIYKQGIWQNQNIVRFPSLNYLRFPNVLTAIPRKKEFGDLEGGLLVDLDLQGEGIEKQTEVPKDLTGWKVSEGGLFVKENRYFVPFNRWYEEQWNAQNGALIALTSLEGAEALEKIAVDSKRNRKPLWKIGVESIGSPTKAVPILDGYFDDRLILYCDYYVWCRGGCSAGVLK